MRAHVKCILTLLPLYVSILLDATLPHSCRKEGEAPAVVVSYTLKDLGVPNLSTEQLTKLEPLYSLAPVINNRSQIAYNKKEGAYLRDPNIGEYALSFPGVKVYSHAINNNGEVLVSLERPSQQIEWMLWDQKSTLNMHPEGFKAHIDHLDKQSRAFFCDLNDCGVVIGYKEVGNTLHPFIWEKRCGLHPLGYYKSYDISGFPRGINNHGLVAGFFEDRTDSPPFAWNCHRGLNVLRNYRTLVNCLGWIELADMVVSDDSVIYGTYIVKYVSSRADPSMLNRYYMYSWKPETNEFKLINVEGMRIGAINRSNTMVGSYRGKAAIYYDEQTPIDLNSLIISKNDDWQLLEATSINDLGQIVGYGTYKGELHIFLLETTL